MDKLELSPGGNIWTDRMAIHRDISAGESGNIYWIRSQVHW